MKPLLVGESNPYQTNEDDAMRYALYPRPPYASGWRLCRVVMGLDERTYLRAFDRINLCHGAWDIKAARVHADQLFREREAADVLVLCGAKVAKGFGLKYVPFTIEQICGPALVVLPHPSGLNRLWHQPDAVKRARDVLREAGVLTVQPSETAE